jgi:RNA polymerase sigma-70 factor (ECF subfamily)
MDQREFVHLFRPLLPKVSAYLNRRVPAQDVEDLASKVFELAWSKREGCPEGFELAWTYRICGNVVSNYRRKASSSWRLGGLIDSDGSAPSAEDLAIANLSMRAAFEALASKDRQILSLFAFDGLTVAEIGTALNLTPNAATQRLKRARAKLAAELEKE